MNKPVAEKKENKSLAAMLQREAEYISECNNHRRDYEVTVTRETTWETFVMACFLADLNTTRATYRALILGGTYEEMIAYCEYLEKKVLKKKRVFTNSPGKINGSIKFASERGFIFDYSTAEDDKMWFQIVGK
jgi:hypothetical protein